jgi:hypothetical protein
MATTFKTFLNNDVISSRTLLNEALPLTGTIVSGTYGTNNIKNYAHGMFQSVFDYPYLSSSANHIFDLTLGFSPSSVLNNQTSISQQSKKKNIYNQMAQILMGYDTNGDIRRFDEDGDLTGGTKMDECLFVNFARLLTKDEIKKGSFAMEFGVDDAYATAGDQFVQRVKVSDVDAQNEFRINSPAGEYGILIADSTDGSDRLHNDGGTLAAGAKVGLIFYQAGVVVLSSSLFKATDGAPGTTLGGGLLNVGTNNTYVGAGNKNIDELMISSSIETTCDAVRNRIYNVQFNNTTELNSTIYFCRVNNNDFNYSSNPTYLSGSKIVVKETSSDEPVSYITTIGMYSADNELLAVAKLSEPLKKTPSNEFTLRVRLDY